MVSSDIFDRDLFCNNLRRSLSNPANDFFLYKYANDIVADIVNEIPNKPTKTFYYGVDYPDFLEHKLKKITHYSITQHPHEEDIRLNNKYDLVISNMSIHFINNIPQLLNNYYKILDHKGRLVLVFLGNNSLQQLRKSFLKTDLATYNVMYPRVIPMVDIKSLGMLLQQSLFKNVVVSLNDIQVNYDSIYNILKDLKSHGLSSCLKKHDRFILSKKYLNMLEENYCKISDKYRVDYNFLIATSLKD